MRNTKTDVGDVKDRERKVVNRSTRNLPEENLIPVPSQASLLRSPRPMGTRTHESNIRDLSLFVSILGAIVTALQGKPHADWGTAP